MVAFQYVFLFASWAFVQADLQNYIDLIHRGRGSERVKQNFIEPSNVDGIRAEQRSDLNDELNLVGDDRIPLDYDLNEKPSKVKEPKQGLQTSIPNLALNVVKDVLFNQPNTQYDYKECIGAMANIIAEEQLVNQIKNMTIDGMRIISNATQMILKCQEKESFSTCLTLAVNEVGAAFVAVAEDIEHALFAIILVGEKLFQQIKLCIGRHQLPVADIVYALLHYVQFNGNTHLKQESIPNEIPRIPNEIPRIPNEIPRIPNAIPRIPNGIPSIPNEIPSIPERRVEIPVSKRNPFFSKDRWFHNFDIV